MEDTYSSSAQVPGSSKSSREILRVCASLFDASGGASNESLVGAKALEIGYRATTEVSGGGTCGSTRCIDSLEK